MIDDVRKTGAVGRPIPEPESGARRLGILLLNSDVRQVSLGAIAEVETPCHSDTWFPIPHIDLVEEVRIQLAAGGFEIGREGHAMSRDGLRYFGVLEVRPSGDGWEEERADAGYGWVLGLRNSHDKSDRAGLVAGTRVFVCDNLAFSGEARISRRHTRFAARDLPGLTASAVGRLGGFFARADERVRAYRAESLGDIEAHDMIVRAVDQEAIRPSQIPQVLEHWRKPEHKDFEPRNAWSLFNAFTESLKPLAPSVAVARGEALHRLFDRRVGLRMSGAAP